MSLRSQESPRRVDRPEVGFFTLKLVKNGPDVAARIARLCHCTVNGEDGHDWRETCDRYPALTATIDGDEVPVDRVWLSGARTTKAEYDYLIAAAKWARDYNPSDPKANPRRPIDLNQTALPF